jgi:hypothetical protein
LKRKLFYIGILILLGGSIGLFAQDPETKSKKVTNSVKKSSSKKDPKKDPKKDLKKAKKKKKLSPKEAEAELMKAKKSTSTEGKVVDTKSLFKDKINTKVKTTGGGTATGPSLYRPVFVGNKMVTGNIVAAQGFRVCIYNGTSRDSALIVKKAFMKQFRNMNSYMSYNLPYYKIKVGDWDDKKTAANGMKPIAKIFPVAFLIPDQIVKKNILIYRNY